MVYADLLRSPTYGQDDIADLIDGLIPNIQNQSYSYIGTTTGSASVHAGSASQAPSAYANGQLFMFRAGYTNTSTATLNVNSLGAVNIYDGNTRAALVGGEIVANGIYTVVYYSSVFYLLNPTQPQSVTWSPTVAGFSANPTGGVFTYQKIGRMCTLFISGGAAGTSNATTYTYTLPFTAATRGGMEWKASLAQGYNNGAYLTANGLMKIVSAGTVVNLYTTQGEGAWTGSGGKVASGTITYETAS